MRDKVKCYNCNGKGKRETIAYGTEWITICTICGGTGKVDWIDNITRKRMCLFLSDWRVYSKDDYTKAGDLIKER